MPPGLNCLRHPSYFFPCVHLQNLVPCPWSPSEFFDCVLILCNILYFLHKAPSHKFVVSHWGRTSSLVAKLTSSGQPSHRGSWKSGSVREGCNDCSRNRQGNITAIKSDKPTTSKNWPAWLTVTPKSPVYGAIMKITPVFSTGNNVSALMK